MTSVLLEEREAAARVRVDGLREEAARLAEVLEAAEIELDRRVIAREELVEALAVSAAGTIAVTEVQETVCSPVPVPGSTVPPWRDGLPVTVLAPDYRRILGLPVVHVCVSLTSADAGCGAWTAGAGPGPSMVRILVYGEGGGVLARAVPDMTAVSSADLIRDSQHPAVPGIGVRLGLNPAYSPTRLPL